MSALPAAVPEDDDEVRSSPGAISIEAEEGAEVYSFGTEFQVKIVAMLVRDTNFAQLVDGLVRPEYFELIGHRAMVAIVNRYYERYKKAPGDKVVLAAWIKECIRTKMLPPEMAASALSSVPNLFSTDISDREFVADEVAVFARHQAMSKAILDSVELVEKRDFDAIGLMVKRALETGVSRTGTDYDYAERLAQRTQERKDKAAGVKRPTGITTGFPVLDDYLYHKGWGRREMAVLMGGPKAGKSMAMIGFAVSAIAAGYNTLYVTLEVSEDIIAERIDANIAERAMMELDTHIFDVHEKVNAFMAKAATLKIAEYPSGSMRASDLNRLIEHYKAQGINFDLVVVDYADLMAPERMTDNVQENSKSVYVNLRGGAMREGYALLTATQTNREGAKKAVATMTDVAEDLNKIRIADLVISINKTADEAAMGRCRLFFAASRNQRSGFSVLIEQNIDQAKFITKVLGEE